MITLDRPVIVEGKYDKIRLSNIIDAQIIVTDGFGIFKNHEKAALLRALARKTPLIVLTDPDGAGRLIRSHISGILPKDKIICLHIPKIEGKEKRKSEPSKEGTLGVEGMEAQLIHDLLLHIGYFYRTTTLYPLSFTLTTYTPAAGTL